MALKNVLDPTTTRAALREWWARTRAGSSNVEVEDLEIPQSSGMSSETVLFRVRWDEDGSSSSRELVARMIGAGGSVFPTYDFHRERHAMDAVRTTTGAPAPAVVSIEDDASVLGAPFLVMERLYGRVLSDDPPFTVQGWLTESPPQAQATLLDNGLSTLAEVHRADISGFDPDTLGHAANGADPLAQHLRYWKEMYGLWGGHEREHATVEAAFSYFDSHTPKPSETVITWGDARLGNMMFDEQHRVAGVLDWELVALGPRELDLSWFMFTTRMFTDGIGVPAPPGFPDRAHIVARYEELTGATVSDYEFYEIFSALRISIIMLRLGNMMISHGLIPADAPMPISNPASHLLAAMLDQPPPTGAAEWLTGNR